MVQRTARAEAVEPDPMAPMVVRGPCPLAATVAKARLVAVVAALQISLGGVRAVAACGLWRRGVVVVAAESRSSPAGVVREVGPLAPRELV